MERRGGPRCGRGVGTTPRTARFKPVRRAKVEPDPVTGELRPVIKRGESVYVYLCREERDQRGLSREIAEDEAGLEAANLDKSGHK